MQLRCERWIKGSAASHAVTKLDANVKRDEHTKAKYDHITGSYYYKVVKPGTPYSAIDCMQCFHGLHDRVSARKDRCPLQAVVKLKIDVDRSSRARKRHFLGF